MEVEQQKKNRLWYYSMAPELLETDLAADFDWDAAGKKHLQYCWDRMPNDHREKWSNDEYPAGINPQEYFHWMEDELHNKEPQLETN